MFNPVFGAEVRCLVVAFPDVSSRFGLCSWLTVAVNEFYALFRQNTKR